MSHISYSAYKDWAECPHRHKKLWIERVSEFVGNIYTSFGTAIHETANKLVLNTVNEKDIEDYFSSKFSEILIETKLIKDIEEKEYNKFVKAGKRLSLEILPELKKHFGDTFKVISSEKLMMVNIPGFKDYKFKGFIDLVIKVENKYHIIDFKSTSWGWNSYKKSDPLMLYQLMLYKHFWALENNIEHKDIETHFILLKRTPSKKAETAVEIFRVSSGKKRMKNSIDALHLMLDNITKKHYRPLKNRLACKYCDLENTIHCQKGNWV